MTLLFILVGWVLLSILIGLIVGRACRLNDDEPRREWPIAENKKRVA